MTTNSVPAILDLMDCQRLAAFSALEGLSDSQLWQRPAPKEWSIGEILDHTYLLISSLLPVVQWIWKWNGWYGRLQRKRPYATQVEDAYRAPRFPQWVGFLWTPRFNTRKPVSLSALEAETMEIHARVRAFYENKDEAVLGNLYLFDPLFGWCNLIVSLRLGIYHDQLHYEDATRQAKLRGEGMK